MAPPCSVPLGPAAEAARQEAWAVYGERWADKVRARVEREGGPSAGSEASDMLSLSSCAPPKAQLRSPALLLGAAKGGHGQV
eukprot:1158975-Pelagomonas_calceolata.AAC.8